MTTFSFQAAKQPRPALAVLGLGLLGLASCQTNIDAPLAPSAGTANFTRYIAVGNSLTAGYEDGGLYLDGQLNSYPNILAQQFAKAGGGAFNQPLFTTAQASGSGYLKLSGFTVTGSPITTTVPGTAGRFTPTAAPYTKYLDRVDNLGVPGIQLNDIQTANFGNLAPARAYTAANFNPYYERITPDGSSLSYFQRVKAEVAGTASIPAATFFTCWLGNNDVLGYATAGGAVGAPTRTDTFNLKAVRVINALTAGGAKGVVSNIPDVTGIPFFTTVGPAARATFAAASVPVTAAPFIYTTGTLAPGQPNTRVATAKLSDIRDASGNGTLLLTLTAAPYVSLYGQPTGKYWRDFYTQAKPSLPATVPTLGVFLLALGVDTTKAFGQTTQNPFPSTLVLDGTEQTTVTTATTAFNASLQAAAAAKGLAFFNANTFFRYAGPGIATNAVNNSASYISGNLFSLDGVHPTPRGYALIANEMIKAINATYGANIPSVAPNDYRAVPFP